jgi:hypothetical protein
VKHKTRQEIPATDNPKKTAAYARALAEQERRWQERLEPMREMVEAILGAEKESPEVDKT